MFGNFGMWEIIAIFLIALLLFGAKRLPEIGASMGKGIRDFKRSLSDTERAITDSPARPADRLDRGETETVTTQDEEIARPEPKRLL